MEIYGEGSITRAEDKPKGKCRKWKLRVSTDHGQKDKRFTGTYAEAKKALERYKAELLVPVNKMTFREYAQKWYDRRERGHSVASQTLKKDRNLIRILNGKFGSMEIGAITTSDAIDGLLDIRTENGYSGTYMRGIHEKMITILRSAVKDGTIQRNVLENQSPPKVDTKERKPLTDDQFNSFMILLDGMEQTSYTIMLQIVIFTGLRRGELAALTWDDIDFADGLITVRHKITDSGKMEGPKSEAGYRSIPISTYLSTRLDSWMRLQKEKLSEIGKAQAVDTPVITSTVGTFMSPQNIDRWWRANRVRVFGLTSEVRLHDLRHTFLTRLAHNTSVTSSTLQDIAGWSSINMAQTYVHEDAAAKRQAMDEFDDYLRVPGMGMGNVTTGVTTNVTTQSSRNDSQ